MTSIGLIFLIIFQFEMDMQHSITTRIELERIEDDREAYCKPKEKLVRINLYNWEKMPLVHKRELIYHELGHCEFKLKHVDYPDIMRMGAGNFATKLDGSNWKDLVDTYKRRIRANR